MYKFEEYIGCKVRRFMFVVKHNNQYYHLLSIIEQLSDNMTDLDAFQPELGYSAYRKSLAKIGGNKDKVFLYIDKFDLSEEFLKGMQDNFNVDGQQVLNVCKNFTYEYNLIPIVRDKKEYDIIPQRQTAAYVSEYVPQDIKDIEKWKNDSKLLRQLGELSLQEFKVDICKQINAHLGSVICVAYNPTFRGIDWKEDYEEKSIIGEVDFYPNKRRELYVEVVGHNQNGETIFIEKTNVDAFLFRVPLNQAFHKLDIIVKDAQGSIIDRYDDITFIHQCNMSVDVYEKTIRIHHDDKEDEVHDKFFTENVVVGVADTIKKSIWDDEELTYQRFEQNLDFVFLDGDKDEEQKRQNRAKGICYIQRILNSAHEQCYICDPYFEAKAFDDFIWRTERLNVKIKILSAREDLKHEEIEALRQRVKQYNENVKSQIECKLLKGESLLHDRFIIADDNVWMLGCSLNHFGEKATTIIRVPQQYKNKIIKIANQWWTNEDASIDIESC